MWRILWWESARALREGMPKAPEPRKMMFMGDSVGGKGSGFNTAEK
jgi:hypothetical protein